MDNTGSQMHVYPVLNTITGRKRTAWTQEIVAWWTEQGREMPKVLARDEIINVSILRKRFAYGVKLGQSRYGAF